MSSPRTTRRARPIGVTLIAIVQFVNAVTLGVQLALADRDPNVAIQIAGDPGVFAVAFLVFGLATAFGLWFLHRWAWVATMLWAGAALASGLFAYFDGRPVSYQVLGLTVLQVFYLNLSEVQEAFRRDRHVDTPAAEAAP